jgi:hypothetical protein
MATIVTRAGKGSPLTNAEVDANFNNLNNDKLEVDNPSYTGTLTGGTGVINIGSGQFYKNAGGNVGIGTSSPGFPLDVQTTTAGTTSVQALFRLTARSSGTTGLGFGSAIDFYAQRWDGLIQPQARINTVATTNASPTTDLSSALVFHSASNDTLIERARITSSGNLGIGTSSPTQRLDVNGTIAVSGLATRQILAIHSAQNTTTFTRTSTTNAVFGATITITPVSANSRFLIFAQMVADVTQSGGDNDARATATACVQNTDGTFTAFQAAVIHNLGVANAGTNPECNAQIAVIRDTNARSSAGNLVVRHFGSTVADGTAGQVTTLTVSDLQVIAVEYL